MTFPIITQGLIKNMRMITKEILQQMLIDKANGIILPVSTYTNKEEK